MARLRLLDGAVEEIDCVVIALDSKTSFVAHLLDANGVLEASAEVSCEAGARRFFRDYGIETERIETLPKNAGWIARRPKETINDEDN